MRKKPKELNPKRAGYKDWYSIRIKEELAFWHKKYGWDENLLAKTGLALAGVSAKSSIEIGSGFERRYKKDSALILPCGIQIEKGKEISSPQTLSMSITNTRVDSIIELNQVFEDLCDMKGLKTWTIERLELYNTKKGMTLHFKRFNPDETGVQLYLHAMDTYDKFRFYYDIPIYEQQSACNHIYELLAHCEVFKQENMVTKCSTQRAIDLKAAQKATKAAAKPAAKKKTTKNRRAGAR